MSEDIGRNLDRNLDRVSDEPAGDVDEEFEAHRLLRDPADLMADKHADRNLEQADGDFEAHRLLDNGVSDKVSDRHLD